MYVVSETEIEYSFNLSKPLLTWTSECNQQVGAPLFQGSYVPDVQEIGQIPEETDKIRACHQRQQANKSTEMNKKG